MTTSDSFRFFDTDSHCYEPRDSFTRYIDPKHRERAVRVVKDCFGKEFVVAGDRVVTLGGDEIFEVGEPGSLREMLRKMDRGEKVELGEPLPEYIEKNARLAKLDEQNVEKCVLFPSLAMFVEHYIKDDADLLYASHHAFNRWVDEEWGFAFGGRIFPPALISFLDVDRAARELRWVLDRGARVVCLKQGPAYGRSPADRHFDPFWALANEAKVVIAYHITEAGYNESISSEWGEAPNPEARRQSAWQWSCTYGDRPIMDTIAALVLGNLFGRFPNLRVLSAENGAEWLPYIVRRMDKMRGMARGGPWIGGPLKERPSEIAKRHVSVSPYAEDRIADVVAAIGSASLVFGSDWPHPEGIAEPRKFLDALAGVAEADVRRIMCDNGAALLS